MLIGVDIGNCATKTSEGIIFNSVTSEADGLLNGIDITIDGINYCVGVGVNRIDTNKVDTELALVCMYTALAMSSTDNNFTVVTGLPIAQYKTQAKDFENYIMKNNRRRVCYNNVERTITIDSIKVYAQGAGALYSQYVGSNAIVVDIGSLTSDIALFEIHNGKRSLSKYSTLYCGMFQLYSRVISAVNNKFKLSLPSDYAETIFNSGLTVDGEPQDLSFLKPIIANHLQEIFNELDLNYPVRTIPVFLCGGGAYVLSNAFTKKYKNSIVLKNSQFSNAVGFKKVGENLCLVRK